MGIIDYHKENGLADNAEVPSWYDEKKLTKFDLKLLFGMKLIKRQGLEIQPVLIRKVFGHSLEMKWKIRR